MSRRGEEPCGEPTGELTGEPASIYIYIYIYVYNYIYIYIYIYIPEGRSSQVGLANWQPAGELERGQPRSCPGGPGGRPCEAWADRDSSKERRSRASGSVEARPSSHGGKLRIAPGSACGGPALGLAATATRSCSGVRPSGPY